MNGHAAAAAAAKVHFGVAASGVNLGAFAAVIPDVSSAAIPAASGVIPDAFAAAIPDTFGVTLDDLEEDAVQPTGPLNLTGCWHLRFGANHVEQEQNIPALQAALQFHGVPGYVVQHCHGANSHYPTGSSYHCWPAD